MIRNKAAKALIIGACLIGSSMAGVYADTNTPAEKPAIVDPVKEDSQIYTIQIESVKEQTPQTQKQQEIDKYVFEDHRQELEQKGITVVTTCVVGDVVEVAIAPYSEEHANYLYDVLGKDMVKVVAGEPVSLDLVTATSAPVQADKAVQNTSVFAAILNSIVEWIKSIF